jgi:hypothetical protein
MDHPYSFWADLLSKFQGATPWIQALWLVLAAAVAMGVVWCVADVVKHVIGARRRGELQPRVIHGIVEDGEGRWVIYDEGVVSAVLQPLIGTRPVSNEGRAPALWPGLEHEREDRS